MGKHPLPGNIELNCIYSLLKKNKECLCLYLNHKLGVSIILVTLI